eukprot:gene8795-10422_t
MTTACQHQYCVIGGGPGGVQMAYFLHKANRDYVLFEKHDHAAPFFEYLPRHRKLISINKKSVPRHGQHPDFRLRHDWNSLLSENALSESSLDPRFLFGNWSDEYYPDADDLVRYLNYFVSAGKLNVQYSTEVSNIFRRKSPNSPDIFDLELSRKVGLNDDDNSAYTCACSYLIVATGLGAPNNPENMRGQDEHGPLVHAYEDVDLSRENFRGKEVLILGKGNAAFELASNISAVSAVTTVLSRTELRMAYMTHYPGDVRGLNSRFLDQYQLKSLDQIIDISDPGMDFGSDDTLHFTRWKDGRVALQVSKRAMQVDPTQLTSCEKKKRCFLFDVVVRCIGWKFNSSMFGPQHGGDGSLSSSSRIVAPSVGKKYPHIDLWYQSMNEPNVYFAGTLMHSHDWRKSAGGFIHGFRYLVRALHNHLEESNHGVDWPSTTLSCEMQHIADALLDRVNTASGLYQMFSFLTDVVVLNKQAGQCSYLTEYSHAAVISKDPKDFAQRWCSDDTQIFVLSFQYGEDFHGCGVLLTENRRGETNNFLHPVITQYACTREGVRTPPMSTFELPEDLDTDWRDYERHVQPLQRYLLSAYSWDAHTDELR